MRLETERLVLRDWRTSDVKDLVEGLNDPEVAKWLSLVPHPYTKEHAKQWLHYCAEVYGTGKKRGYYELAIELKSERKVIGVVSIIKIDRFQGTAGGGIWISAEYQRQGYGTEAFGARLRFAFEKLKLRRLENGLLKGNASSLRMQKRFGYRIEGLRRKGVRCMADGKLKDEYMTALLKEEWKDA